MDKENKNIDKLRKLKALMDEYSSGGLDAEEIKKLMSAMAQMVTNFKDSMSMEIGRNKKEWGAYSETMKGQISQLYSAIEKLAETMDKNKSEMSDSHMKGMKYVEGKIPKMPDLTPLENRMSKMFDMCEKHADGEYIVNEINSADTKIKRSQIEGLDTELKRIEGKTSVGMASRRVYQPYQDDFSSQTDGTTKTFYLSRAPLTSVVFVFGTDFPTILRPTIDFTVSDKILTLTSAIPAPNQGATLLVQYYA